MAFSETVPNNVLSQIVSPEVPRSVVLYGNITDFGVAKEGWSTVTSYEVILPYSVQMKVFL